MVFWGLINAPIVVYMDPLGRVGLCSPVLVMTLYAHMGGVQCRREPWFMETLRQVSILGIYL